MVIVDTTVWVDYFLGVPNPETDWLDTDLDRQRLGLTDIVLCEVLQSVHDDSAAADVERRLRKLEVFKTGGVELAIEAARNYRVLRARGHTVRKMSDCLIATLCIRNDHRLLHRDGDFDPFETYLELSVIDVQRSNPRGVRGPTRSTSCSSTSIASAHDEIRNEGHNLKQRLGMTVRAGSAAAGSP